MKPKNKEKDLLLEHFKLNSKDFNQNLIKGGENGGGGNVEITKGAPIPTTHPETGAPDTYYLPDQG